MGYERNHRISEVHTIDLHIEVRLLLQTGVCVAKLVFGIGGRGQEQCRESEPESGSRSQSQGSDQS